MQPRDATTWVVRPADLPDLGRRLAELAGDGRVPVVVCDLAAITEPDVGTVGALARLQLAARRLGGGIQLYRAPPRLRQLIALAGLDEVLPLRVD